MNPPRTFDMLDLKRIELAHLYNKYFASISGTAGPDEDGVYDAWLGEMYRLENDIYENADKYTGQTDDSFTEQDPDAHQWDSPVDDWQHLQDA